MISLDTVCRGKLLLPGFLLLLISLSSCLPVCSAQVKILNLSSTLTAGQTLVSVPSGVFELGIFPYPSTSKNYYLCIRYASPIEQVVTWLANRDSPISDTSNLILTPDGILQLQDLINNLNTNPWSTSTTANPTVVNARLNDTGNLVLLDKNGVQIWDSFLDRSSPSPVTDTLLPGQKLYRNQKGRLTSWRAKGDPSAPNGAYSFGWEKNILSLSWTSPKEYLKTWRGGAYIPAPDVYDAHTISNVDYVYFHPELGHLYINSKPADTAILSGGPDQVNNTTLKRITIDKDGGFRIWQWTVGQNATTWTAKANWVVSDRPDSRSQCTTYGTCGPYGQCISAFDSLDLVNCTCPQGFYPLDVTDMTAQGCALNVSTAQTDTCANTTDMFELDGVDMPWGGDYRFLSGLEEVGNDSSLCRAACQTDCHCAGAVYSRAEQMCWLKTGTLYNIGYPTVALHGNDRTTFIKNAAPNTTESTGKNSSSKWKKLVEIVVPTVVVGALLIVAAVIILYRCRNYERAGQRDWAFPWTRRSTFVPTYPGDENAGHDSGPHDVPGIRGRGRKSPV